MKTPCELTVWYLLPAIRSELTKELKKHRFKQVEIAKKFGITPAAVSLYLSKKRGYDIELSNEIKDMIKALAKRIADDDLPEFEIMQELCAICVGARKTGLLCQIHRSVDPGIPKKCDYWCKIDECVCTGH